MWEICTLWKMCISGTDRIQLSRPLFTWFLLYFMLGMGDFRVIKLFPSCPESPSLYSILSSCVHNCVTAAALPACRAHLTGLGRSPFSCRQVHLPRAIPNLQDSHFLPDWLLSHPYFQRYRGVPFPTARETCVGCAFLGQSRDGNKLLRYTATR